VPTRKPTHNNYLVIVLSLSLVLGMAVALGVYFAWRSGAIPPGINLLSAVALLACPPFIMSVALPAAPDSDVAMTLLVGAMVFGNAFLYAGVAAGGYFVVQLFMARDKQPR
jgi:hypothetical protein